MRDTKTFAIVLIVIVVSVLIAQTRAQYPPSSYAGKNPQASGIFPQVVTCVPEHEPGRHTGPNWQPTLRVTVEPGRDPGRVREYRVLGCSLYYYHRHF